VSINFSITKNQMIWLLPWVIFVGLTIVLWTRLGVDPKIVPQAMTNQPLPQFGLPSLSLSSTQVQLKTAADLPRKPFILHVWGSWCPTCIIEQRYLLTLADQGVILVGVNYKDQTTDAQAHLVQHGNPYVLNVQDLQGDFGVDLGVTGAPESFVIDQNHRIRLHIVGEVDDAVWRQQVQPCLNRLSKHGAGPCV
jgi:cytochrome c biogenesis protein CcmG, thiol:disulfide interchange protein DsbE